ncbi:MAG: type V CRISPR-associated endonuclease Cas1 [Bacteroidaceae bacterium]|nr:type V CRISPR-associated endonuclease Cas1 [Bacteroidaceae bacterium]
MFTSKDIEYRTVFVINCLHDRDLRVSNGELLLEEQLDDGKESKILTKLPFQKILALFIVGHIRITTPLIEKCQKFGVALIVMKPSFRPVFYLSNSAEANYLLRKRQYEFANDDISIAKVIVTNKIQNQLKVLNATRKKDDITIQSQIELSRCLSTIPSIFDYNTLMGIEGFAAKQYFKAYYQEHEWHQRRPRTKCDALNSTLDIGYTMLFNYIECFIRMFGFDLYVGIFHRMWYKRKSLVCDLMEPFRPIIDKTIRTAWNRKQISFNDFHVQKGEYHLKHEKNGDYCKLFFDALIPYKADTFKYIQSYYRCFMGKQSVTHYPIFNI